MRWVNYRASEVLLGGFDRFRTLAVSTRFQSLCFFLVYATLSYLAAGCSSEFILQIAGGGVDLYVLFTTTSKSSFIKTSRLILFNPPKNKREKHPSCVFMRRPWRLAVPFERSQISCPPLILYPKLTAG